MPHPLRATERLARAWEVGRYEVGLKFKYYELSSEEKAKIVESLCEELRPIEGG